MKLPGIRRSGAKVAIASLAIALLAVPLSSVFRATSSSGATGSGASDSALALQQNFVRVVNSIRPSVVEISTESGLGSGVVYDARGDVVTNAHVVGDATTFTVTLSNGKRLSGRLVGTYLPDDLAVLRVASSTKLTPARLGNSSTLRVGDLVLAMGNPLGLSSSVTDGIVSFNGRTVSEGNGVVLPDLIQTSAAINPGNSGGALANLAGQVIGIPTLAATNGSSAAAGLGFAIPSDTVKLIAPQLIATGKVTNAGRAALGISGTTAVNFSGAAIGVAIVAVESSGPAAKAGIVVGDLITAINGKPTPELTDLQTVLAGLRPGTRATVSVTSKSGQKRSVSVLLGDLARA